MSDHQHPEPGPAGALAALRDRLAARGHRLFLGLGHAGQCFAAREQSVLVIGPPRSGKTSSLVIPNVLVAPGAVVVTSTKADVLDATVGARAEMGRCWLFDPVGAVADRAHVSRLRWSPVGAARSWDEALLTTRAMVGAARPGTVGEANHWTERAEALLAPLLHAASIAGGDMRLVVEWVNRHNLTTAMTILASEGAELAVSILDGIDATDPREQSGIWSTAAGVLGAYRSAGVLDSTDAPNFDPLSLAGSGDTVYVCAPARHQALVAPLVVALLEQVRAGAYRTAASDTRTVPLTLVLDELANIAPLPDLPSLVSEGGSQGVLTLACLQDLSQARARWGAAAEGFVSLFGAKVILPGVGDLRTLQLISALAGQVDVPVRSVNRGRWWSSARSDTVSWSVRRQPRLGPDAVAQQPAGTALLLDRGLPPSRLRLGPWYATEPFSERDRISRRDADRRLETPGGRELSL